MKKNESKGTTVNENPEVPTNSSNSQNSSTSSVNWMDKLKPSAKNRVIQKRYQQLSTVGNGNLKTDQEDLTKYGIDTAGLSRIGDSSQNDQNESMRKNSPIGATHQRKKSDYLQKWNKFVVQSKFQILQIETNDPNQTLGLDEEIIGPEIDMDASMQCFEEIGNLLEEKYTNAYNENMYLNQQDGHSIIPFLLISCKEIHRMCLSDYEIKHIYKSYKSKSKSFKAEAFDYYRIGLINFYKGKYFMAYNNLRNAVKLKSNDPNISKWFCFVGIIILFCENGKLDFLNLRNKKFEETEIDKTVSNSSNDEGFTFFGCCSTRKVNEGKIRSVQMQIVNNNIKENNFILSNNSGNNTDALLSGTQEKDRDQRDQPNYLSFNFTLYTEKQGKNINHKELADDIMTHILCVIEKDNPKNLQIEGWWIMLLISTFVYLHKNQKLFQEKNVYEPKYCIKKIKEKDDYLSYISYAEYNYLIDENYQIDKLLKQLIHKYPNKVEAYLRYWQLLTKGKFKNYEQANKISEFYWKNSSTIQFDDGIYGLYILITHAKTSYLIGNHFYAITYFQKEYPSNFLFPSIYYLFGKYSSKSNSKSLKNVSLSSLKEVFRLLYEDLQYSVLYWLGNIYYNIGSYDQCFKVWRNYLENAEKSFDVSLKKTERIKGFLRKYEVLWNSMNDFKKNLNFIKKIKCSTNSQTQSNKNLSKILPSTTQGKNNNMTSTYTNTHTNSNSTNTSKLTNYLKTLQSIKEIEVNLKMNKNFVYDYYKALCYFYIDKNVSEGIRILMNIINTKKHYMNALFALWKILAFLREYKLLLNLSYFIIKIAHRNEVSASDWIKSYMLYSKALMYNKKYDEAIILLINTLDLFAHVPLEEAKYLNSIYKQNKISTTNFFVNFDKALQFYSKYHVYKKSQAIFQHNYTLKKGRKNMKNDIFLNNVIDIKSERENKETDTLIQISMMNTFKSSNTTNSVIELQNKIDSSNTLNDLEIDNINKLEEYIESNIDSIEVPVESPCKKLFF
jgi:hypothetical protein